MPTPAAAQQLRSDLADLVALAERDLDRIMASLTDPVKARERLMNELPRLVTLYGPAAATTAADWYDNVREQENVNRRFRAITADLPADLGTDELARWGLSPVFSEHPDWASALTLVAGGLQKRILAPARATVTGSSVADPSANGWQRVGSGECDWCEMLISRGGVYTKSTSDFAAHDHCKCAAMPAWGGRPIPVEPYTPSVRQSEADQQRAKRWIAANL